MLELTVKNYANRTGVSEQAVRKQIKNNKLRTCKKSLDGRITTLIQVEEVERQNTTLTQPVEQDKTLHSQANEITPNQLQQNEYLELIKRMYADNTSLSERNTQLAQLAGQTKLLTDSENRTKDEYFKISQENKILVQEKAEIEAKLKIQNSQIEELKAKLDKVENKEIEELKAKLENVENKELEELKIKLHRLETKENNNWWSKL